MIPGRVIGEVWATRKVAQLGGRDLKLVAVRGQAGTRTDRDVLEPV